MKKLYEYQQRAHDLVYKDLLAKGRALMVMAPGLGKTVVSAFVLKSLLEQELQAEDKILFLCHDNYILRQAHAEYKETLDPEDDWGFEDFFGSIKNLDKALSAKVVFGSFQSMNSPMKWYQEFDQQHFAAIVVDEGHHAQASTFKEVLDYFDPRYSLGMTGTPDRQDNLDIRQLFGEESVNITIEEGIANGWLTKVKAIPGCEEAGIWKGSALAK